MKQKSSHQGFTIIELLIATTVFTVILLLATTGVIKIGNLYYKNIISSRTQEAVRSINSEITSDVQFSKSQITGTTPVSGSGLQQCIGDVRYTYFLNTEFKTGSALNTSGLYAEKLVTNASCNTTNSSDVISSKQMLGNNMRLLDYNLVGSGDIWTFNIAIAYGDDDLLDGNNTTADRTQTSTRKCLSGIAGSSFCATAKLDTTIKKRLN